MDMIKTLRDHWVGLLEGNLPPFRSEISPKHLPDVLDNIFILEKVAQSDIRIRIAGLAICEMMGMEVRGQSPLSMFADDARVQFDTILHDLLSGPKIATISLTSKDKVDNTGTANMIILPLRSDFGDVNRAIGCIPNPEDGFTAPLRFSIDSFDLEKIAARKPKELNQGFNEPTSTFDLGGNNYLRSINCNEHATKNVSERRPDYLKPID